MLLAVAIAGWGIYVSKQQFELHAARASHIARLDDLTGVLNRRGLAHACKGWVGPMSVAVIDLDDFKLVNDTYGHAEGDKLLRRVAQQLSAFAAPGSLIARLGGDEFAVVATELALPLQETLGRALEGASVHASIGEAHGVTPPSGDLLVEELLRSADHHMYAMKRAAKGERL